MLDGFLVTVLTMGMKMRLYMGMKRTTMMVIKDIREANGTSKLDPIDLFLVIPCLVKKVDDYACIIT